jgi:hypothetical protein
MRKKRITIPRGGLSPFTASAILQLMQEFNRKEDVNQCLALAKAFKERAAKLKKEPCRQPSKKKKRTESDKLKRAKWFGDHRAGRTRYKAAESIGSATTRENAPTTRGNTPTQSAYDAAWARQDAERDARESPETLEPMPKPVKPAAPRPPQKGEPGYVGYLLEEIDRRKAAGTWKPE